MEGAKSNYYGKQFQQISCFMSTTKALLGNLTEIPVRNTCYCFQILTNFIVLAKKITSQPGIDCISRHIVTEGACNKFSGAMLNRGGYVMYGYILCPQYILFPIPYIQYPTPYRAKQGQIQLYTALQGYTWLNTAMQSHAQLYWAIHSQTKLNTAI